ncbi:MAG: GAF domain-containing protein, partial [Defluviitaleaceae bacterium]|nr:GAF domain-containing protein [Defluviitaleaceae bacterium]
MSAIKINRSNIHDIEKIIDVVLSFGSETRYSMLLDIILTKMIEITHSDAGTLYILEDNQLHFGIIKNASLNIYQSSGLVCINAPENGTISFPPIPLDKNSIDNISAYAAINNKIVAIDDVYTSRQFNFSGPKKYDKLTGYRTQSMLVLPLSMSMDNQDDHVLGVIQLINATDPKTGNVVPYNNIENPPIIPSLSKIASNTLGNLLHMQEIRELFRSFVAMLTQAIDERSSYNNLHTQNVAWYCNAFAKYLNTKFEPGQPLYFDETR